MNNMLNEYDITRMLHNINMILPGWIWYIHAGCGIKLMCYYINIMLNEWYTT